MKKRILSMLLVLVMILGMIPATAISASAANEVVYVDSWDTLKYALTHADTLTIKLSANIEKKVEMKEWMDMRHDGYEEVQININGNKTLDLNGYDIKVVDESNATLDDDGIGESIGNSYTSDYIERTLFFIPEGSTLTVNDSGSDGSIAYTGRTIREVIAAANRRYTCYAHRDLFEIEGELIINGGKLEAGNTEKQYICDGRKNAYYDMTTSYFPILGIINYWDTKGDVFNDFARQMIWGTVANVKDSGKLVVNGGTLIGRGEGEIRESEYDSTDQIVIHDRDSVIEYESGSSVVVNSGVLKALGGANVFEGSGDLKIRSGAFYTDKHDNVRCLDSATGTVLVSGSTDTIIAGSYGNLGIPKDAWWDEISRMRIMVGDEVYFADSTAQLIEMQKLELENTAGVSRESSGQKMEVVIAPYNGNDNNKISVNGGPYTNYETREGQTIKWNNGSSPNLVTSVEYDPYFEETDAISGYKIEYNWHIWTLADETLNRTFTSRDSINILVALNQLASWDGIPAGGIGIECTITERSGDGSICKSYKSNTFYIQNTKTPLTEDGLPGGAMNVGLRYYPATGSATRTQLAIHVEPTYDQMNTSAYGNSKVNYWATYEDAYGEEYTESWTSNYNYISDMQFGHVPVDVHMSVYGADGTTLGFDKSIWAVILPDISLSGGAWGTGDADKRVYYGTPGSTITLTAPFNVADRNATVESQKLVSDDIQGWYKVGYDANGNLTYSLISGTGDSLSYGVTTEGSYAYGVQSRSGDMVYSNLVQICFDSSFFNLTISGATASHFEFLINSTTDYTYTATYGEGITPGRIFWRFVGYPEGAEEIMYATTGISAVYTGETFNFKKPIKFGYDYSDVIPGVYTLQAFYVKDGVTLAVSNAMNITVHRNGGGADITKEDGTVISGQTLEGPYVGNTMQLLCTQANGGDYPVYSKGIEWELETLVGEDVASIDQNGVLTAKNPGQVRVTVTAKYPGSRGVVNKHTQTVIINIPITEFEVTLGTPAIGGEAETIPSLPADAPYEFQYVEWTKGVSNGLFYANGTPEVSLSIKARDGYVMPMKQLFLASSGDDTWFTYEDECTITINGTKYNITELMGYGSNGYTVDGEYGNFTGSSRPTPYIYFDYAWDRLKDPNDTYLQYINATVVRPAVGDPKDVALDDDMNYLDITINNTELGPYTLNISKVSGDYLNDNDVTNDNAVSMGAEETYQVGQAYRLKLHVGVKNEYYSSHYFGETVSAIVNGKPAIVEPVSGSTDGASAVFVYYYFVPTAERSTLSEVYIYGIRQPEAYAIPAETDEVTMGSGYEEAYVTRLHWYVDNNGNGQFDEGEDSSEYFNGDGSFKPDVVYCVYLELGIKDRDDDGMGDFAEFTDNVDVYLAYGYAYKMTGNQNGANYEFPVTGTPEYGLITKEEYLVFNLKENYLTSPWQSFNVESVGTTEIEQVSFGQSNGDYLELHQQGLMVIGVEVKPGLEQGVYKDHIYITDEDENCVIFRNVIVIVGDPLKVIDEASATITEPIAGGVLPTDVTVPVGADYTAKVTGWYDSEGNNEVTELEPETTYMVRVQFIANENCRFQDPTMDMKLNGKTGALSSYDWDYTTVTKKYQFTTPKANGYTINGTITSSGSQTDMITVELYKAGSDTPVYKAQTKGNSAVYAISNVLPGTYTMKVMKAYHLPFETTIVVSGDTVEDVELVLGNNGKQFKFNSAYLNLTQDINVVYITTIPEEFTNPYVVFEINGKSVTVTNYTIDNQGRYCFKFQGVNPHWMGENIRSTLYATVGGTQVSYVHASYSVKQYCKSQLSKTTDNALKALLSDLLVYGEKAQLHQGHKTNELVTAGLTLYPSTFQALGAEYNKQTITGTKNSSIDFGGAGLYLSNNAAIRYTITTSEPTKYTYEITIKGKTRTFTGDDLKYVEDGKYNLFFDGIMATEFDEVVTAKIFENGIQVGRTVEYSVNTYIQKYQNDQTTLGPLLRALYNYGNSATNYDAE